MSHLAYCSQNELKDFKTNWVEFIYKNVGRFFSGFVSLAYSRSLVSPFSPKMTSTHF